MVSISESAARAVLKLLDDIEAVDAYAHCSDSFFRTHFKGVVLSRNMTDARRELTFALEAATEAAPKEAAAAKPRRGRTAPEAPEPEED